MMTAEEARKITYKRSFDITKAETILDTISKNILDACHKGRTFITFNLIDLEVPYLVYITEILYENGYKILREKCKEEHIISWKKE